MSPDTHQELSEERTGRLDVAFEQLLRGFRAHAGHGGFPRETHYILHGSVLEIEVDLGHGHPDGFSVAGHSHPFPAV